MAAAVGSGGPYWPASPHLGVVRMMLIIMIIMMIIMLARLAPSGSGEDENDDD